MGHRLSYLEYVIRPEQAGLMVKAILRPLGLSRRLRRQLVGQGGILVNGRSAYLSSRVSVGDRVTIQEVREDAPTVAAEDLPLRVVWEDAHALVVDKPAGMLVHPTGRERTGTLLAAVHHHVGPNGHARPLHRLDRDTSGLVLFSRHKLAHDRLSQALLRRQIEREYWAFLAGAPAQARLDVTLPIAVEPGQRIRRMIDAEAGQSAVTHFLLLAVFPADGVSLVQVRLETGRTHQIRVHAAAIGHPVLGDALYGEQHALVARHALHARRLTFPHPLTGAPVAVRAGLPVDLARLLAHLSM